MIYQQQPQFPITYVKLFYQHEAHPALTGQEGNATRVLAQKLLLRGTQRADQAQFMREVEGLGAELSLAYQNLTQCLNGVTLSRHLPELLGFIHEMVATPRLDPEQLEQSKRSYQSELASRFDDDGSLAWIWLMRRLFIDHPLWSHVSVTSDDVSEIQIDQVSQVWSSIYTPERLLPCVITDLSETELQQHWQQYDDLNGSIKLEGKGGVELPALKEGHFTLVHKGERKQAQIFFAQPAPSPSDPRYLPLSIAITAMGGMFSSPLMQEVRVKRGLSYGAYASIKGEGAIRYIVMNATPDHLQYRETMKVMMEVYRHTAEGNLSDEEIHFAQRHLIHAHPFSIETPAMRAYLMAKAQLQGIDPMLLIDTPRFIEAITPDQVREAARACLDPNAMEVLVLTDHGDSATSERQAEEMIEELPIASFSRIDARAHPNELKG